MYAIAFDLISGKLRDHYSASSPQNAYAEVRSILQEHGFLWQQGSVYLGEPRRVDAITCVLAAQRLASAFPWFTLCVRDLRMLRIEENNDLLPAIITRG